MKLFLQSTSYSKNGESQCRKAEGAEPERGTQLPLERADATEATQKWQKGGSFGVLVCWEELKG